VVTGRVVLAATPIGNVADASPRLREALEGADVLAAEDTRRLRRLAADLSVRLRGRVVSFHDAVERERAADLVDAARDGALVVVVTDAGMPTISDPGYRVVSAAIEAGIDVSVLPGPSAVLAALAVSGLPVDRFCFEGFLPRKAGERDTRLRELRDEPRTMVFYEAPHRLPAMLAALATALGEDRPAAVCRELTKTYEEVRRAPLGALAAWAEDGVRGEITVVVAGAASSRDPELRDEADWVRAVATAEGAGIPRKEAMADVARRAGVRRSDVYEAVVRAKVGSPHD
jgi:16S rRNA (cytidine1402-2'-O)-methyltransferase